MTYFWLKNQFGFLLPLQCMTVKDSAPIIISRDRVVKNFKFRIRISQQEHAYNYNV